VGFSMSRVVLFLALAAMIVGVGGREVMARAQMMIAVVVNESAITQADVDDRMTLIMVSAGLPNNKETRKQLLPQIVGALVDEQIKVQEALKLELDISEAEIDSGFATIAGQNNFTPEQFEQAITRSGVKVATLRAQVKAEIAWSKVVQARLRSQVNISASDVDARLGRIVAATGKNEYLLSEIYLPIEEANEEVKLRRLAERLSSDIRGGKASFMKVAQQFSKAAGAASGGDLGWIQQGQLPDELDSVLPRMQEGGVSKPIRSLSGFHIMLVRKKRVISEETIPARDAVRQAIGLERLDRLQRQYFLDLKSSALIENRLEQQS
jgi:peptidyl-prolyl cis-trans isomerase SurA